MARIAVLGPTLQNIYLVDHDDLLPSVIGTEAEIDKISYQLGGSGLNAAISLARHDHEVILISNIAKDFTGNAVLGVLDTENIDSSYLGISTQKATDTTVVLLNSKTAERTILSYSGISSHFDNFHETDLALIQPDWLYISSLGGDLATLARFLDYAHTHKIKTMLNPGPEELKSGSKFFKILKNVDVLLVNHKEANAIFPSASLQEQLVHLSSYTETVIITDGHSGGIATNARETYRFGIYEDKQLRDTTGAGDAFGAGFLAHFAANHTFADSLVFASANATAIISTIGANQAALTNQATLHPMPIQKL